MGHPRLHRKQAEVRALLIDGGFDPRSRKNDMTRFGVRPACRNAEAN